MPLCNVYTVFSAVQVPLLMRHPETKALLVNFDPLIYQVIREAECMRKLDLPVPNAAGVISYNQQQLKNNHAELHVSSIREQYVNPYTPTNTPTYTPTDTPTENVIVGMLKSYQ